MLEVVKTALRVTNPAFDGEIDDLIASAQMELIQAGVSAIKAIDDNDPLIRRAIIIYAKANYGLDGPNAERFAESFTLLKNHLSLAGDYNGELV